jgi:hypothetical protein
MKSLDFTRQKQPKSDAFTELYGLVPFCNGTFTLDCWKIFGSGCVKRTAQTRSAKSTSRSQIVF